MNRPFRSAKCQLYGAVVGAEDVGMDRGIVEPFAQTIGDDEVIDAPASILLARLEAVRPPRILHLVGVLEAETVGKSRCEQLAELGAFLVGKASVVAVGLGILDVDLLMSHIEVAAEDDGLLGVEALKVGTEGILPRHAVVEALQTVLRVGRIAADQKEIGHLEGDNAPFVIVLVDTDAIGHAERLVTGEDGCARIALLFGIVPIRLIALEGEIELPLLHLRLLKTEEVGIQLTENLTEPFALAGAEPIHIPTDKFHTL